MEKDALVTGAAHAVAHPLPAMPGYWWADAVPPPPEKFATIEVSNCRCSSCSITADVARSSMPVERARRRRHPRGDCKVVILDVPVSARLKHPPLTDAHALFHSHG